MKRTNQRRHKRRGFTLMELLVVLGILVLLMAIVTPKIIGTQAKADIKTTGIQIGALRAALDRYALEMRGYPATEQGLEALVMPPASGSGSATAGLAGGPSTSNWDGPYTSSDQLPIDPWGNPYQYEYPPTQGGGKYPDIWSYGPDGQDGTPDDIVSWSKQTGVAGQKLDGELDLERELNQNVKTEMPMERSMPMDRGMPMDRNPPLNGGGF